MLPSAGQSHSALGVTAPVVCYCTPLMPWCLSTLAAIPNISGFPTMDVCVLSQHELWNKFLCSWLISIFSLPSGFTVYSMGVSPGVPRQPHNPSAYLGNERCDWPKTCTSLPNASCPSNSTTVTFSLSFTCKSSGIRNAMLLPLGEEWESVKPGRASVMVCPDLLHGGGQRASSVQKMSIITFLGAMASQKSSTTFIYDTTLVPMASH